MKFRCRKCRSLHNLSSGLMVSPINCSCGNRFRMCDADFRMNAWSDFWRSGMTFSEFGRNFPCPYCGNQNVQYGPMNEDGSIPVVSHCQKCCQEMPGPEAAPIVQIVLPEEAEIEYGGVHPGAYKMKEEKEQESDIVMSYREIYKKAVEENGGKDLTDAEFQQLLKKIRS